METWESRFSKEFPHLSDENIKANAYLEEDLDNADILTVFMRHEAVRLKTFIRQEVALAVRAREENLERQLEAMKPILWHENPHRHSLNIERHNTLDEAIALLKPKQEI